MSSGRLVKITGRKVQLKKIEPTPSYELNDGISTQSYIVSVASSMSHWTRTLSKEERFVNEFRDCFPFEKQGRLPGTLATIQAYAYLRCSNGLTLWQNWKRYG